MKKLMIAAAIVCAAAISQAATVSWSSGVFTEAGADGTGWGSTTSNHGAKYSDVYSMVMSIYSDAAGENLVTASSEIKDIKKAGYAAGTLEVESPASGVTGTWYAQLVIQTQDGKSSLSSDIVAFSYVGGDLAEPDLVFFSDEATGFDTAAPNLHGYQASDKGWVSVPEPTSGLLLLLGVAGLALRRRRA